MATPSPQAQAQPEISLLRQDDRPISWSAAGWSPQAESTIQTQPSPVARLILPQDAALPAARRLIVLIPDQDIDEVELARRIWTLASPRGLAVVFLGLCRAAAEEPRMRRRLVTLAAVTRDKQVKVETRLEFDADWLRRVNAVWRTGDIVVCHAEQATRVWGIGRRPLSQALASSLKAPVYVLSGFCSEGPAPASGLAASLISWAVPLAIIVAFFWLQVQIDQLSEDWAQTTLLYLSVLVEIGLIWMWHRNSL